MISASEAREISNSAFFLKELREEIEAKVMEATEKGEFDTIVYHPHQRGTKKFEYLESYVKKELSKLGYSCEVRAHTDKPLGCPEDQWDYSDNGYIVLKW